MKDGLIIKITPVKMNSSLRYFLFLLWTTFIMVSCVLLFTGGFLLRRNVLPDKATDSNIKPAFEKAIILVVDALKYDFAVYDPNVNMSEAEHFQNRLPVMHRLLQDDNARLFKFIADPPTTTMQRLKGLTTGSLPTFMDVSSNFGSYEITEDNVLDQLVGSGRKKVVFAGDDTWMGLFPTQFTRSFPFPSFDVWDLDTVDRGVNDNLFREIRGGDWDVAIGHYLGVDHAGHKFGPRHPEMARKLGEMNTAVERAVKEMPEDCILLVFGDHGMTMSGDHGGDSADEVNAALFAYTKKGSFSPMIENEDSVEQVDLVPTLSLLLGVPIPFSNLGKIIPPLLPASVTKNKLAYLNDNVGQVMRYLDTYRSTGGGALPQQTFSHLRERYEAFQGRQKRAMSISEVTKTFGEGLALLTEAKEMCAAVWVNFDLRLMAAGTTLLMIQITLLLLLLSTPRNRLITGIVSPTFISYLWLALVAGIGLSCVLLLCGLLDGNKAEYTVAIVALAMSVMLFGFNLLWKLRDSFVGIISVLIGGLMNYRNFALVLLLCLSFFTLFSNSFVVEEAAITNFLCVTSVFLFLSMLRKKRAAASESAPSGLNASVLFLCLFMVGLLRLSNVYFRCREEQSGYCTVTDFHKPIGTLPKDGDEAYKTYRQWRFFSTLIAVFLTVTLPHFWLRQGGNLNGHSLPVSVAVYLPGIVGLSMICYWALQGHPVGAKFMPWQHNLLAQLCFGLSFLLFAVCLLQPKLLFKEIKGREVHVNVNEGVHGYFAFIRSQWKNQFSLKGSGEKVQVFGLGTCLSAPLLVLLTAVCLVSMLLLGDGLCFSACVAFLAMGVILLLASLDRVSRLGSDLRDLFSTSWPSVFSWWLLETLFFYSTGHQPTFPTLQWSAAFVGVSGANFGGGGKELLNFIIPATLMGWNTFVARILFGLALPLLMLTPFTLWLRAPWIRSVKPKPTKATANGATPSAATRAQLLVVEPITLQDLEQGEVVLLERCEETRTQLFLLCVRYLLLHGLRLFGVMLSAAALRRHLMVWKIFAPRFLFEALGFLVTAGSVLLGFAIAVRVLNVMLRYYGDLNKEK